MHKILEHVDKELKEFEGKQSLTMGELQCIQMLVEIKKDILKIEMLEEGVGSHDGSYDRGYSERRRRDSRGRFRSSYDGDGSYRGTYEGSYRGGSYEGGYHDGYDDYERGESGHIEGKQEMIRDLRGMMERCKDLESRETIQKWMKQLENAR